MGHDPYTPKSDKRERGSMGIEYQGSKRKIIDPLHNEWLVAYKKTFNGITGPSES